MKIKLNFLVLLLTTYSFGASQRNAELKFRDINELLLDSLSFIKMHGEDSTTININLLDFNNHSYLIKPEEFIDSMKYIPLQTTAESLITGIEKIKIFNNHIYILDVFNKSLLVFTNDGKFVRKIGREGRGPQEFINPIDFAIDKEQNKVLILDDKASKVLTFSLEGEYLEESFVGFRFNDFFISNDSTYIVNTDVRTNHHNKHLENYKLLVVDKKWNVLSRGNLYDSWHCSEIAFSRNGLYPSNEKSVLYNPTFSYTIYELRGNDFFSKYRFNVGSMKLPDNFECGLDRDQFYNTYSGFKSTYAFIDKPIVETKDWLITTFRYRAQYTFMFYNRNTGKVYWNMMYKEDNDSFIFLAPMRGVDDNDQLYSHTSSLELKNSYVDYKKETGRTNEVLESIKEGDNCL